MAKTTEHLQKYVTCFPGKRDNYALVSALVNGERLGGFITDFYHAGWLGFFADAFRIKLIKERVARDIPSYLVKTRPSFSMLTRALVKFVQPSKAYVWEDLRFAKTCVNRVKKSKSNLLLYEFQAEYAFKQKFDFPIIKVLFQFHPHPAFEHPILFEEAAKHPTFLGTLHANCRSNLPREYHYHTYASFNHASHVIVASHFTKQSLIYAGCDEKKITVVPYGISQEESIPSTRVSPGRPYFLFVGSGSFRKGLHNLIHAWNSTQLHLNFDLVIISRVVDTEIAQLMSSEGVIWIKGVSKYDLTQYFKGAHSFVLPSFSEGFGQVYLEALASGCPVIGTRNSMLPDIPGGDAHIRYCIPGDEDGLAKLLTQISLLSTDDLFFNKFSAKELVKAYTWTNFSKGVLAVLDSLEQP